MRKLLGILIIFFLGSFLSACAEYYPVELIEDIDKNNLPAVISVKTQEDIWISDFEKIEKGSLIKGQVKKVIPARRLERDAYISFFPISFTILSKDVYEEVGVNHVHKTKLRPPRCLDKKDVAANTIGTGLSLIPPFCFIVPGVQFCMGVYNQKPGEHPCRAGCRYLVESWPFCYCLKGTDVPLTSGSVVELYINEKIFAPKNIQRQAL